MAPLAPVMATTRSCIKINFGSGISDFGSERQTIDASDLEVTSTAARLLQGIACGFDGCGEDTGQFAGFLQEGAHLLGLQQRAVGDQFEPVTAFVGFFFNDTKSGQKFFSRTRPASRTIVCS